MAFAAKYFTSKYVKYFSRKHVSKQIETLAKALESVSTNLSIIALFGLVLVPLVPHGIASTSTRPPPTAEPTVAKGPPAPVEVVRAKPVLVPQAPLQLEATLRAPPPASVLPPAPDAAAADPDVGAAPSVDGSLRVLARVSRERRRRTAQRPQPESGELGKASAKAAAAKTPVPEPKSDPKSETAKVEPPPPDEWSDGEIIAALKDCLQRLAPLGADIEVAAPVKQDQCGNPAPVLLKRIGSGANRVEFQPPPVLNCAMVASMHTWVEKTLQPAAQEILGSPIVRLRGAAGYACRNRAGTRAHGGRLSEHATANAIDIMGFVTADGRTIDVLSKWGPTARDMREQQERLAEARAAAQKAAKAALEEAKETARQAEKEAAEAARAASKLPASKQKEAKAEASRKKEEAQRKRREAEDQEAELRRATVRTAELQKLGRGVDAKAIPTTAEGDSASRSAEAAFLRRLHKGACTAFGTVLGPEANEAHRNHFHFDLAPRRRSAYCE
jgi:hypothetical protein